jgi:hypothetical protein
MNVLLQVSPQEKSALDLQYNFLSMSSSMLRLSTEFYVKRAHPLSIAGIAIRKIASLEDDRLGTELSFTGSDVDIFHRHEVRRGPSVERVQILSSYYMNFSTALIRQLQL